MSCVPKEACEHELNVRIATSDRLAANMNAARELCRERGPVHRVSTIQSRSLDHVKDLVSRLVHLSLSLRMSGHMKLFRACMRTVVESKLTLLQGACGAEAADYRSYMLELFLVRGQFAAKRRSLLWVWCNGDWRNKNATGHYVDPAGPFAQTRSYIYFSASGKCILVDPRVKATVSVPSPSVDGCDLACDEVGLLLSVQNVLFNSYLVFRVSCGVKRARPFAPASRSSAAAALPDCPALQRQQGGCNGEDEDGDDDGDGSEDEVALQGDTEAVPDAAWSSGLTETDWHTP